MQENTRREYIQTVDANRISLQSDLQGYPKKLTNSAVRLRVGFPNDNFEFSVSGSGVVIDQNNDIISGITAKHILFNNSIAANRIYLSRPGLGSPDQRIDSKRVNVTACENQDAAAFALIVPEDIPPVGIPEGLGRRNIDPTWQPSPGERLFSIQFPSPAQKNFAFPTTFAFQNADPIRARTEFYYGSSGSAVVNEQAKLLGVMLGGRPIDNIFESTIQISPLCPEMSSLIDQAISQVKQKPN